MIPVFWELPSIAVYENAVILDLTVMRTMPGGEDPGIPGMTFTVVEKDGE